jgi:hypothetical protein
VPRYQAITRQHGYTIAASDALAVTSAAEFMQLLTDALD